MPTIITIGVACCRASCCRASCKARIELLNICRRRIQCVGVIQFTSMTALAAVAHDLNRRFKKQLSLPGSTEAPTTVRVALTPASSFRYVPLQGNGRPIPSRAAVEERESIVYTWHIKSERGSPPSSVCVCVCVCVCT